VSKREQVVTQAESSAAEETGSHVRTEAADTYSETGSEDKSTAETDAALSSAQQAQREAMLVSHNSLNDSRKRLLEVREAMQQQGQSEQSGQGQQYGQQQNSGDQRFGQDQQRGQDQHHAERHSFDQGQQRAGAQRVGQQFDRDQQYAQDQLVGQESGRDQQYAQDQQVGQQFGRDQQCAQDQHVQDHHPGPGHGYDQAQELLPDQEPRWEQRYGQQRRHGEDQSGEDQPGQQYGQDQQHGQGQRYDGSQQYSQAQAGMCSYLSYYSKQD